MSVLTNWKMQCPACGESENCLDVEAKVMVRLTGDGTDADASEDGGHEWDEKSVCGCASCGWTGTVGDAEAAAGK